MVYEEFISTVSTTLKSRLGSDYTVMVQKIPKNNGILLDGLCITKIGERITPTIYLGPFFEHLKSGAPLSDILDEIVQVYTGSSAFPQIDPDILTDFSNLEDKVVFKLVHTESNEILLTDIPHVPFLDLSIIFYLFLEENEYGHMTATIHNINMTSWNMTAEELYRLASANTPRLLPAQMCSMDEVIEDLLSREDGDTSHPKAGRGSKAGRRADQESLFGWEPDPLYVLSNTCGINGACTILYDGILKNFADQLEQDLVILPSSIHEVLLVPYSEDVCLEQLSHMVRHINLTEVPVEERLSDEIYRYRRSDNLITLVSQLPEYQTS